MTDVEPAPVDDVAEEDAGYVDPYVEAGLIGEPIAYTNDPMNPISDAPAPSKAEDTES